MQVDGVEDGSRQNVSPGPDTNVGISPLEVTSALKRALSHLSQPPLLQLVIYRSPSYHLQTIMPSRSVAMEFFVEEGSHAASP